MTLDPHSVDGAIRKLWGYRSWLKEKANEISRRLAEFGEVRAIANFANAIYDGPNDTSITVEQRGSNTYAVVAQGTAILFIEFGAGITHMGSGHPELSEYPYGAGSWPDRHYSYNSNGVLVANWMNDRGWYLPKEKGGGHTFGNPPNACMYHTGEEIKAELLRVAREVFSS